MVLDFLVTAGQITMALWLGWKLLIIPVVYTHIGLRDGGRIGAAWAKSLGGLVALPLVALGVSVVAGLWG